MDIRQYILLLFSIFHFGYAQASNVDPVVGVIAQKNGKLNLYSTSKTLKAHHKIGLLDSVGKYTCCLYVNRHLANDVGVDTPLIDYSGALVNVYALEFRGRLAKKFQEERPFGVALRQGARVFEIKQNTYTLHYAGEKTVLTICTSQEGLHIITKRLSDDRPLAHLYYYFGYDVEPTCGTLSP